MGSFPDTDIDPRVPAYAKCFGLFSQCKLIQLTLLDLNAFEHFAMPGMKILTKTL